MKRISLILLTFILMFSGFGVSAKNMLLKTEPVRAVISCSETPAKKADCKNIINVKSTAKTQKQLRKEGEKHFYSGPVDFLAKLFPVLFNFNTDDAPTCAAIINHTATNFSHGPPTV